MIQIIDSRGTGKTSKLMALANADGAAIICSNPYAMKEKARDLGYKNIEFVSYYDFIHNGKNLRWSYDRIYYIDEIEMFMNAFVQNLGLSNMNGYSATKDNCNL